MSLELSNSVRFIAKETKNAYGKPRMQVKLALFGHQCASLHHHDD